MRIPFCLLVFVGIFRSPYPSPKNKREKNVIDKKTLFRKIQIFWLVDEIIWNQPHAQTIFTKVKRLKPEKENIWIIASINTISLFISSLFYGLLNIKIGPGFYKNPSIYFNVHFLKKWMLMQILFIFLHSDFYGIFLCIFPLYWVFLRLISH